MLRDGGFWVFGYGSLMWRPGFAAAEARLARLDGYRRAFALASVHYRGTPEFPGLVLGLDWAPGRSCTGMALRVAGPEADAVRAYLAERELVSRAYFEVRHPVTLFCDGPGDGPRDGPGDGLVDGLGDGPGRGSAVEAICYILDRTHPQYAGGMAPADQADIIRRAVGPTGSNRDYLLNTVAHLRALGIDDPELLILAEMVQGA